MILLIQKKIKKDPQTPTNASDDLPFQEIPKDDTTEEELSADDYDIDQKAEILALGKLMHNPVTRTDVIDSTANRYMFPDDGSLLPEWFKDDEGKHNKPLLPVTKEMVTKYKEELKGIDARSTKKVAEAKARKKKRYLDKLQKARTKAKQIAGNSDISEREKVKQIQKLYKGQLNKVKPQKVYVVGRKVVSKNMAKGKNVRMKLVDPRLKKDKRGRKAADKRNLHKAKKRRTK